MMDVAKAVDSNVAASKGQPRAPPEADFPSLDIRLGSADMKAAYANEMEAWRIKGCIRQLWAGDASLWTENAEDRWLGWLTVVEQELADLSQLKDFAERVRRRKFTDVVVLGMGGSSLGPEVLGQTFGDQPSWPRFHMLDSTDPAQIQEIEHAINLARTLFIVSSKSGGTLEPNIFLDYFADRVGAALGKDKVGAQFVAVTDRGSSLDERAKQLGFADVFYGVPTIGGRYSVLSKFGLAPAAATGLDIRRLLETAQGMIRSCGPDAPSSDNPGVQLGVALGIAATRLGRDKVTIIASPGIAGFGAWLEQLLAESTGKRGRGLIPLAGEPLARPERYGADRFFAYLELEHAADPAQRAAIEALESVGHPVAWIRLKDIWSFGAEFFRWEIAVAVAGAIIGIDPFDQPDVEASKQKTNALIKIYETTGSLPHEEPLLRGNGLALYADQRNAAELGCHKTLSAYLRSHLARVQAGDYVALLTYIARNPVHIRALTAIRTRIRDRLRVATCLGFGPRFQHSTGQAFKGGPNTGVFLQSTSDDPADIDIPGHPFSFGVVKAAQAQGDFDVLAERGRRLVRIHLTDVDAGLVELAAAANAALETLSL